LNPSEVTIKRFSEMKTSFLFVANGALIGKELCNRKSALENYSLGNYQGPIGVLSSKHRMGCGPYPSLYGAGNGLMKERERQLCLRFISFYL